MGNLISTNIDDFIEDFLKNVIKVDVLDYQKVESGGEGSSFKYWYHFVEAQICIIDDGINFLNEIKSKEGEIIEIFANSET